MGRTSERGYGWRHQQERAKWAKRIASGGVRCAFCGRPIDPFEKWDLGHDDFDRSRYTGPEHRRCNRATRNRGRPVRVSRKW